LNIELFACKQPSKTLEMNIRAQLEKILQQRILIIDGAMGTMIQRYCLEEKDFRNESLKNHAKQLKGNNDLLSVTRPDIVLAIHREYLEAGADIIETNTFSGTTIAQADYGLEHLVYDINYCGAKIARQAADEFTAINPDKPRFVAGAIGPTNKTLSISPDVNDPAFRAVTFDELVVAFKQQIKALTDGGVDILLFETIIDTLNAKAGLYAAMEFFEESGKEYPIMVSGTITDASGRTLSGQTTEAFLISVMHAPLLSIGLNCALGAAAMRPYLQTLAEKAPFYVSVYPNAGLPNEMGQYDESPEYMSAQLEEFLKEKLINILGGCCGTTPQHIKVMAQLATHYKPRALPHQPMAIHNYPVSKETS
jgi:5-methyltetrahydrofolate--homocysteine methyltransferase